MSDESEDGVHRLLDMVVEEVSLVDRAANQRRFLVVKRDDMAKKIETEKAEGSEEGGDISGALQAAVAALESLSAIVELLGSGEAADDSRLETLASELRQVAEQISSSEEPSEVEEAEADEADVAETEAPAPASKAKKPKAPRRGEADEEEEDAEKDEEEKPRKAKAKAAPKGKPSAAPKPASKSTESDEEEAEPASKSTPLDQALEKLAESVSKLTETVQQQQERLGRVEKQFGVPNSSQAPETPAPKAKSDDGVGWPLDLNKPLDRESVDKSLSFHDV